RPSCVSGRRRSLARSREVIATSVEMRHAFSTVIVLMMVMPIRAGEAGPTTAQPATRREEVKEIFHGVEIVDAYRWLEDQQAPETRAWIDAQNAHTSALLKTRPSLPGIADRLSALLRVDHTGIPEAAGGRYFLWKKKASDDLSILYVREGLDGKDTV